ncbi:SMP-30/gluconolactonase/LRE family protein [Catalinimonas sp. 4WD22]|uniref:SMP-30/gluconolactonase/LRE family protein n=1 Tax=Catalinimonas locisalis TaxID=3133978 RepID=UPI0031012DE4
MLRRTTKKLINSSLLITLSIALTLCTSSVPEWQAKNEELIGQYKLAVREISDLPSHTIASNPEAGETKNLDQMDSTALYPGVSARLFWGSGAMAAILRLAPNAEIPEAVLSTDRFVFVMDGSIELLINGEQVTLLSREREEPDGTHSGTPRTDFVYLEKGSQHAVIAGEEGAKLLEVSSPLSLDYLKKAGINDLPDEVAELKNTVEPNIEPNRVYDLYDIQYTPIAPGHFARLISGKSTQLSFIRMEPDSVVPTHIHPEEQMTLIMRGALTQSILNEEINMVAEDIVRIPENMVHGAKVSEFGADALDIFWPVRTDYLEKEKEALAAYHEIIPKDAEVELLVDGKESEPELYFAEGPKWMDGKVYFSNMYFDQNFNADPKKSSIVELDPNGDYRNITEGKMQANGLYPYKNGHLLVCDMIGHRVLEMTTEGEVVKVIADSYNGKPIDGPNDIITDAEGGIYFTDPQFTMETEKFQPGRAVYYIPPQGEIIRIVEPNEFAMPNGILLSPDGKTLYINNCYDDESWFPVSSEKDNFIWAYDVNEDGTISNGRRFAKLLLPGDVLDRKAHSSSADGMAIDKMGNIYVCTYLGVQIFNNQGDYIGMINLPSFPVSLCFGDEDMKTLYIVSYSQVYKIRTKMEGFVQYL